MTKGPSFPACPSATQRALGKGECDGWGDTNKGLGPPGDVGAHVHLCPFLLSPLFGPLPLSALSGLPPHGPVSPSCPACAPRFPASAFSPSPLLTSSKPEALFKYASRMWNHIADYYLRKQSVATFLAKAHAARWQLDVGVPAAFVSVAPQMTGPPPAETLAAQAILPPLK